LGILQNSATHEVELLLDIVEVLGGKVMNRSLEVSLDERDVDRSDTSLIALGVDLAQPMIAFGVAASWPHKVWPASGYAAVGAEIVRSTNAQILLFGGPDQVHYIDAVARAIGSQAFNLAGRFSIRESIAALRHCDLYLGNDTSVMHMAAVQGKPVVAVFSHPQESSISRENPPLRYYPWGVPHTILQPQRTVAPCVSACTATFSHCICSVGVDDVLSAATQMLHSRTELA
jgi:heptosyltransferase-2